MTPADEKTIVSIAKVKANRVAAYNRATYGAVIRASRLRKGLTQPQLAKILNTSKNYVSNWEIGKARPDMNMVPALCKALDISIAELFGVRGEYDTLSLEAQRHLQRYTLLTERDRATVDSLIDSLLAMEDAEMRKKFTDGFMYLFHNDNMAAAGTANYLGDMVDGEREFIRKDYISERADEIITVTGDSMEPTFYPGDDLLIEHTESLNIGEIGIFVINGEGFVKEYRENGVYSHNYEAYPFRKFHSSDDVRIVGRVLGKVTDAHRPNREEATMLEELRREGAF